MRIIKEKKYRTVTMRLPEKVMKKVDEVAKKNEISRQELIAAILQQVLGDDKFVLKMPD